MGKTFLKKILVLLLISLLVATIGDIAASFISKHYSWDVTSAIFFIGIAMIIIGLLSSNSGNPKANVNPSSISTVAKLEMNLGNVNIKITGISIIMIISGALMIVSSQILR
jgi:hypothetical protein